MSTFLSNFSNVLGLFLGGTLGIAIPIVLIIFVIHFVDQHGQELERKRKLKED